ncbi:hypothetical protein [Chelativorans sp. YIM 93263]|uniref:hypothetical protein n=1 Tax=Chelativorans sp. YIM 93263 TaxID=2906648 RepID=UPI002378B248|nr:hypothetical protein [Chelativorans sp. YIM 93263]
MPIEALSDTLVNTLSEDGSLPGWTRLLKNTAALPSRKRMKLICGRHDPAPAGKMHDSTPGTVPCRI